MAIYGYVRVSTNEQSYEYQKTCILHFANEKQLGHVTFVDEIISGAKNWKTRAIGSLINRMQAHDILIVNEFSRLGRSLLDILEILKILKEKECQVYIVRENMKLSDDLNSKVMVFMFSLVAEIERDLIKSHVKEGVANKRKIILLGVESKANSTHLNLIQKKIKSLNCYHWALAIKQYLNCLILTIKHYALILKVVIYNLSFIS